MRGTLAIIFLFVGIVTCTAQSTITGNGSVFISAPPMPPTYTYEPKPDITAAELSQVVSVLLPALACRNYFDDCGVVKKIESLPPEVKRHFVRHEN